MTDRTGLYMYLSRPVDTLDLETTRVTEAGDRETHDDQGLDAGALSTTLMHDSTMASRNDSETYDDHAGTYRLSEPLHDMATVNTRNDRDTYDEDHALQFLGVGDSWEMTTTLTKVDGETYDDTGLDGLGVPSDHR